MLKILIDITIDFNSTLLLNGIHKYYLKIRELFLYVKIDNWIFGKTQKNRHTKQARILRYNCVFIYYTSTQIKEYFFTRLFKDKNHSKF